MPEHIRALLFVLVLSGLVWWLARPAMLQIVSQDTFVRWRRLWFITTLAWFLAHSFWVYVAVMTVVLLRTGRREPQVFGLYLLLLMAAPQARAPLPGFGIVNYIFMLDHYRLLSLALLLPCALRLARNPYTVRLFQSPVDGMVIAYLVINSLLAFRGGNFTSDARDSLMFWIDLFLPYYVASRSLRSMEDFRHALVGLLLGGLLLSVLAAFEVMRRWKLYDAANAALGLQTFGAYKTRGSFIRPAVSAIDSIVLGYVIVVASGAYLYLQGLVEDRMKRWLAWGALAMGVLASLSRGPWVGAGLLVFIFMLTSERPFKRLGQGALAMCVALLALSATPYGQQFINLLPYVGQEEQGNVEYRAGLLTVSLPVIERNPLFGSWNFLQAPELQVMMQGEGIIDVVNSYLGVTLSTGLVGLAAFVGMFGASLLMLRRAIRWSRRTGCTEELMLGRALYATLISIMFIIFTVSSILIVPTLYFAIIGISCAFTLWLLKRAKSLSRTATA